MYTMSFYTWEGLIIFYEKGGHFSPLCPAPGIWPLPQKVWQFDQKGMKSEFNGTAIGNH
jgi:hypothetical protein